MLRRHRQAVIVLVGALSGAAAVPTWVTAQGVRAGPFETVCVDVPDALDAKDGDVVVASVTVTEPSAPGHVVAHGSQSTPAGTSSVNFAAHTTVPNLVAAAVTEDATICVTGGWSATAHLIVDAVGLIDGAHVSGTDQPSRRALDTRDQWNVQTFGAPLAAGATVCAEPAGDGVVIANVTVTGATAAGFVTVHREAVTSPSATSTHNFGAGHTVANLTVTPLAGARLCATASQHGSVHVIFDVVAQLSPQVFRAPAGGSIRLLDTRVDGGATSGSPVAGGTTVCVAVPDSEAGDMALVNAAITGSAANGYATVHHRGAAPSATSTHNFFAGDTVGNLTATTLAAGAEVCATPSAHGSAHVVLDLIGHIDGAAVRVLEAGAVRLLDTRHVDALPGPVGDARLGFGRTCAELLTHFAQREHAYITSVYGTDPDARPFDNDSTPETPAPGSPLAPALPATSGGSGAEWPDFSTTNTQVDGIDEADLVETDGRYLYTVTDGAALVVIDTTTASVVTTVNLSMFSPQMILWGSRLLVTGSVSIDGGVATQAVTFDVSAPAAPVQVNSTIFDGRLVATRSIEGNARLVVVATQDPLPDPIESTTVADLHAQVDAAPIEAWLPRRATGGADGAGPWEPALACEHVALPPGIASGSVAYVAEVDMSAADAPTTTVSGVVLESNYGYGITVFASRATLYLAVERSQDWWATSGVVGFVPWNLSTPATTLHAFELSADAPAAYVASHELPGYVLNQFAIGEHEGIVRVAVTNGWWGPASSSSVFALQRQGPSFERLSVLRDLGLGQQIYAVRHLGPVSYVVTFQQTDPLYVADFSDPRAPVLQGELHIPGYSSYLHPIGPGRLIGIGQNATDDGFVTGLQVSLFDVSNPRDPQRLDELQLGGYSDAEHDHHAFLWWAPANTLAVPAGTDAGVGLAVVRVDDARLVRTGQVDGPACGYRRSVVIGDELIAISNQELTISDFASLVPRAGVTWGAECSSPLVVGGPIE
jgi:uncharacterized secreted protein with C-terminal beta-propeller domain